MSKKAISIVVGNMLDHYDTALYALLAPFLAPVFFPQYGQAAGLMFIYLIKATSLIARPIGAIIFGYLAIYISASKLLSTTICGVAICTVAIGFLPGYDSVGILAPILLTALKLAQGIFAAGEHSLAALMLVSAQDKQAKQIRNSSLYQVSNMAGTTLATLAAALVSISDMPELYWRIAFMTGILAALAGIYLRQTFAGKKIVNQYQKTKQDKRKTIQDVMRLIPIVGFSYVTYLLPFVFLNHFLPLVSEVQVSELYLSNISLTLYDIAIIPLFAYICRTYDLQLWMASIAFVFCITILPIFYLLPLASNLGIVAIKLWIITLGVAYSSPLYCLIYQLNRNKNMFLISGIAHTLGTEIFGRNSGAVSLVLWQYSGGSLFWAGVYFVAVSSLAGIALLNIYYNNQQSSSVHGGQKVLEIRPNIVH